MDKVIAALEKFIYFCTGLEIIVIIAALISLIKLVTKRVTYEEIKGFLDIYSDIIVSLTIIILSFYIIVHQYKFHNTTNKPTINTERSS